MADFEALIKARLDTSSVPGQIKNEIENLPVTLENITVNANSLRKEIEAALGKSFDININPVIGNAGIKNAAKSMTNGMATQMKTGSQTLANSLSTSISSALAKQGIIDPKASAAITKSFEDIIGKNVNVNLKSVQATVENISKKGEKLKRLRITAFDDLGNTINSTAIFRKDKSIDVTTDIIRQFSKMESAAKSTSQKLSESIKFKIDTGGITSSISQVEAQFKRLKNLDFPGMDGIRGHLETLQGFKDILDPSKIAGMSEEDLLAQYKAYSKALTTFKNDLTVLRTTGTKLADPIKSISLDNKMQAWMKKNTKAAKEYGTVIEGLRNELKKLDLTDDDLSIIDKKFGALKLDAAAKGLTGKSLFDQVKSAATQMLGFVSVGEVINVAVRGFEEMYQAVYDIDTAMTNLKKVTDETDKTYESFLERSAVSAQQLGRTVSSLVEQTATWSKLGYSLTEAEDLSKLSSIYANVAEVDDATAVSDMVTAMKAFNIESSNALTVVDALNELGNNFAVSAADLGTGLTNSASAMNAAGTDMYKTLAMLTGGSEITQNAGEFGSFLKVASMRLRGMKGELEALGEEVDPTVDSISKVQTQILNLTSGKVNIFDAKGEFRDYYDIMEDIAEIYDDLSSTDKASLTEILFGKMRGNQGQALIQAFQSGQIQKAYATAMGSDGSAYEEQARWMESLEAL